MKRTALTLTIVSGLVVSLVVGVQFVDPVETNPWFRYKFYNQIDPIPGTIPPKIAFLSPKDNDTYSSSELNLTVDLAKPQTPYPCEISGTVIFFSLDGWQLTV